MQTNQNMAKGIDPSASFEDEILSINPTYDLIFSNHEEARLNTSPLPWETRRKCSQNNMKVISKMNEITGIKPIGELATHKDWDDTESIEKETIALMRRLGLEPSIDRPPDENRTIATVPTRDVIHMRNGHKKMSIFMSNTYFELKPRSDPSFCTDDVNTSASTSEFSDDVNVYEPIFVDSYTSNETAMTTLSDDENPNPWQQTRKSENVKVNEKSPDSYKRQSADGNLELSWRRRSPPAEVSREDQNGRTSYNAEGRRYRRSSRTGSSNNSWRLSNESSFNAKTESDNWRSKPAEIAKEEIKPNGSKREEVSNCGTQLFKPKDLFMKKKALLIQQVLAENQH